MFEEILKYKSIDLIVNEEETITHSFPSINKRKSESIKLKSFFPEDIYTLHLKEKLATLNGNSSEVKFSFDIEGNTNKYRMRVKIILLEALNLGNHFYKLEIKREQKDYWQLTFDAIEEVIIILDKELKITRLNKAALNEYNIFMDNPEGLFCTNLYNIGESHCSTCPARATILDNKPHTKEVEYSSLGKTFLTSSLPIFDENKNFVGVVFTAKNITEKKKLKIESEKRLQQVILADRLKSLGELVANVAHEINNPNNFVVQNIALIEKSWKLFYPIIEEQLEKEENDDYTKEYYSELSEEMEELIRSIKIGSTRISKVVANLKNFTKPDSDKFEKLSINKVINSALKIIQSKIDKSFKSFIFYAGKNLPAIFADYQKLEQVFINLIVNAIQARSESRNPELEIKSKFISRLKAVYIEVIDNGNGIGNDIITNLFEPFFTTRRNEGGTGLGLSISKEIIKKHNGIIDVHSVLSKGTIFKIYLPIIDEKISNLSSRMICIDKENSFVKNDIICFFGEEKNLIKKITNVEKLFTHLKKIPEIDILLINFDLVEDIENLVKEIFKINYLYEIVIFNVPCAIENKLMKDGIKVVTTSDEKEAVIEINKILNVLNR